MSDEDEVDPSGGDSRQSQMNGTKVTWFRCSSGHLFISGHMHAYGSPGWDAKNQGRDIVLSVSSLKA